MTLTEEEARNKWCPFSRSDNTGDGANRTFKGVPMCGCLCIASECMAWRRSGEPKCRNRRGQMVDRDLDGTNDWVYSGHCGLAGKP